MRSDCDPHLFICFSGWNRRRAADGNSYGRGQPGISKSSTQSLWISSVSPVVMEVPVPRKEITVFPSPMVTSEVTYNGF